MKTISEYIRHAVLDVDMEMVTGVLKDYIADVDENWNYILPTELYGKTGEYFIVDLRRSEDFAGGHIKGSVNIFWKDILENLDKLPRNRKIILVCYVGHTASQVLVLLKLLGYDAAALKFGLGISPTRGVPVAGWMNYGYELEK